MHSIEDELKWLSLRSPAHDSKEADGLSWLLEPSSRQLFTKVVGKLDQNLQDWTDNIDTTDKT